MPVDSHNIGVVAIGRNEGQRLVRCLESCLAQGVAAVVYVDSGSTDGSPAKARKLGATVVDLDMSRPFTAARARNAGWSRLPEGIEFVQFIDGDCELADGWLAAATVKLREDESLVGVAGRLKERHPDTTPYNRLCDLEWAVPPGETGTLGGIAMFRLDAVRQVEGYDETLIAGEEPEMCVRLRQRGGRLWRLAKVMGYHDADMHHFSQWWKRAVRCGHAHAEVSRMHSGSEHGIWVKESHSTTLWTLVPPVAAMVLTLLLALVVGWPWWLLGLAPLGLYALLLAKVTRSRRRSGDDWGTALLYAGNVTLAKFPQFQGQLRYLRNRARGEQSTIIEYKRPGPEGMSARV